MAGLENINDVVGQKVWDDLERLLKQLDAASDKMIETAKVFKSNPISVGGPGSTKEDIAYLKKLVDAQKEYQNITAQVTKTDKDAAIVQKNLAKARLDNARAADVENKTLTRQTKAKKDSDKSTQSNIEYAKSFTLEIKNETDAINQNAAATEAEILAGRKLRAELDAQILKRREAEAAARQQAQTEAQQQVYFNRVNPRLDPNKTYSIVGLGGANTSPKIDPVPAQAATNIANATKGLNSMWGILRKIAYIVPGLGIAGLFSLAADAILEFVASFKSSMDAAIKVQEDFNESVDNGSKGIASEIQVLQQMQGVLVNNTRTREEINAQLTQLATKYPEYLGFLNVENESIEGINQALANEINLLRYRNLETAARETAKKAEEEYEQAVNNTVQALTTEASFWQKARGFITGQSGATVAYGDAVEELTLAFNKTNEARRKESDVIGTQIDLLQKRAFQLHNEIDNIRQLENGQVGYNEQQLESIRLRKIQIESIDNIITYYKNLKTAADNANLAEDSQVNNDVKYWQARVDLAKKNSKEYISSSVELIRSERDKDLKDLHDKYINEKQLREQDLADNKTYQTEIFAINAKAIKAQRELQEGLTKYNTKQQNKENKDDDALRKARINAEKEYQDALRDNRIQAAEENIQTNKEIFDNENKSLSDRLEAYNEYYISKRNQAQFNADKELADIVQLEDEIKRVEAESDAQRSNDDKALLLRKEGIAERRRGIEIELAADLAGIAEDSAKDILKIQESYSKKQIELIQANLLIREDAAERERYNQLKSLLNQAKEGLITWADYQQQKTKLASTEQQKQLDDENIYLFNQIERTDLTQDAKEKLIKQYYDNLDKLRKLDLQEDENAEILKRQRAKETRDALFDIAQSGLSALNNIEDAKGKADEQRTNAKKDQIDEYYNDQITAVKANGKTEVEQQQEIADLEKKRDNEKKTADRDQAIRARALAMQQKQLTIAQIILATSLAVIKAYTEGDPYTKVVRAIAAGAAGAAQLATALAIPLPDIPAYKDGTGINKHGGGLAEVGDGYVAEWIKEPGKKGYWSPSVPTIMDLPRGTSVTNPDQLAAMATRDAIRTLGLSNQSINESMYAQQMIKAFESLIGETKGVKKAIGNKPTHNTILTERGLRASNRRGNSWTSYIDSSVRN